jgi:hypothetical protein
VAEWLFFHFAGTTTNRRGVVVGFGTVRPGNSTFSGTPAKSACWRWP